MKSLILVTLFAAVGFAGKAANKLDEAKLAAAIHAVNGNVDPAINYGNANVFIDLMLFNINRQLPDKIPVYLPPTPVNLHNCYFLGLENKIRRDGDATLVNSGSQMRFVMGLKMEGVGLTCEWEFLLSNGSITIDSAYTSISAGLIWILESGQHPYLSEFAVTEMAPFEFELTGVFGLNWFIEWIVNDIIENMHEVIIIAFEKVVSTAIQAILNTMVVP